MMTDVEFLATELDNGIGMHNPNFKELARMTVNQLKQYDIKTVLDYGAGTGVYADAYYCAGYHIKAFEIFKAHRDYMKKNVPHIAIIKKPITTDLLNFIETAEHMTDQELDALFAAIAPIYVLFSSTSQKTDNDIPWGHINIKPQADWDLFFINKGYTKIDDFALPTGWTKLYLKN